MRIKHVPADFEVEEQLAVQLARQGAYAVLRVRKRDLTTFQVQAEMAAALKLSRSAIVFPGIKDRRALALQYASVRGNPPERLDGNGWTAEFAGRLDRALQPADIAGNRFRLVVRDLVAREAADLARSLADISEQGIPNYYDWQRFGSYHPEDGLLGAHILRRDAQGAVRAYLTLAYPADSERIRVFKAVAAAHWGEWDQLFEAAPRPSNYRSLLTFLRDHPADWRKALNLIPRQLLSLYLEAYQSLLWNRAVGEYLTRLARPAADDWRSYEVAGSSLLVYRRLEQELRDALARQAVVMPHHRAVYPQAELGAAVQTVLDAEGIELADLKARILDKAYLSRHRRALLLFPAGMELASPEPDERFAGRAKLIAAFELPRGSYATLVIGCAALWTDPNE